MRWEAEYSPPALRVLKKFDRPTRDAIVAGVERLVMELREGTTPLTGITKLVGLDAWRLRLGDYRVVFRMEVQVVGEEAVSEDVATTIEPSRVVVIERVGHRREVYR